MCWSVFFAGTLEGTIFHNNDADQDKEVLTFDMKVLPSFSFESYVEDKAHVQLFFTSIACDTCF